MDEDSSFSARRDAAQVFSGLSAAEQEILDQADRFARQNLYSLAQRMDDEEWWPEHIFPAIGLTWSRPGTHIASA